MLAGNFNKAFFLIRAKICKLTGAAAGQDNIDFSVEHSIDMREIAPLVDTRTGLVKYGADRYTDSG